jgi:hypothetical protein
MTIAGQEVPLADTHHPLVVWTNAPYVAFGIALCLLVPVFASGVAAIALTTQALGSTLFHATPDGRHLWAQLLDAIGIQMVLDVLLAIVVAGTFALSAWPFVTAVACVSWPLWWTYAHKVRHRGRVIAGKTLVIVAGVAYLVGLGAAALTLGLFLVAVLFWQMGQTHGVLHSLWHPLAGAAQGLAFYLLLTADAVNTTGLT